MVDRFRYALRQTNRQIREKLPPHYQQKISNKICAKISSLHEYRHAKQIALYHAVNGEVNLRKLWQSAPLHGKYCYFPALNEDRTLSFLPATPTTDFVENHYRIPEPNVDQGLALPPEEFDIIFLPLVGFDERGTRLGMGQGYYDRTLMNCKKPILIGVAYEFQRMSFLEAQPWDVQLTFIITERTIYRSKL